MEISINNTKWKSNIICNLFADGNVLLEGNENYLQILVNVCERKKKYVNMGRNVTIFEKQSKVIDFAFSYICN